MNEAPGPGRRSLIVGAAMIAIQGLIRQAIVEARFRGTPDYRTDKYVIEYQRALEALKKGEPYEVGLEFTDLTDRLALAQQTLRVSVDEWQSLVPFKVKGDFFHRA
jgi:hypothetical protein